MVNDLAETKIRAAKAECTMAMTFGLVCGGSPSTMAIRCRGRVGLYLAAQLGYLAAGARVTLLPYSASKDR